MSDTPFTDEDVTAGAIALIGKGATPEQIADWDEEVRTVLSAVAPAIWQRGRDSLAAEQYAEAQEVKAQLHERARADRIEGSDHDTDA